MVSLSILKLWLLLAFGHFPAPTRAFVVVPSLLSSSRHPIIRTITTTTTTTSLAVGRKTASKMTLAGKILPAMRKFVIGPAKLRLVGANIVSMTHWVDLLVLAAVAVGARPLAALSFQRLPHTRRATSWELSQRAKIARVVSQVAWVALSVWAADVLCVFLSTIGFAMFDDQRDLAGLYAKCAYTALAVQKILNFKMAALCRIFKVKPDDMGRVDVLDRILNGAIVSMVSLVLLDWLSVKVGMAMRGLFAFGSVGTVAFTLASQGLLTQFLSGVFLILSNKMYVGDYVTFGDKTAGTVTKLGWMETTLRNTDNTITRVPNAQLALQKVSNLSRTPQCQVAQTLRFHYEDVDEIPDLLQSIKQEIVKACPHLITDGTRPFRVFWTDINEDHLSVMVNTHHNLPPMGDAYWLNRQAVLMAIARAVKKHNVELAQLYSFATSGSEPEWRVVPKKNFAKVPKAQISSKDDAITNDGSE